MLGQATVRNPENLTRTICILTRPRCTQAIDWHICRAHRSVARHAGTEERGCDAQVTALLSKRGFRAGQCRPALPKYINNSASIEWAMVINL